MTNVIQPGWHPDPLGQHAHRYFDGATWTEHVADEAASAVSVPPPPPSTPAGPMVAVPGTAAVVTLPDTPEQATKRRTFGIAMLVIAGVVLLAAIAMPWVTSPDGTVTLSGHQVGSGATAALCAVLLGLYGAQGIFRPRVRYHIAAVCILSLAVTGTIFAKAMLSDEEVAQLAAGSGPGESVDVPVVSDFVPGLSIEVGDSAETIKRESSTESGLTIALVGELAAIVPLTVLWKDDRQRRRDAGLLL